MLFWITLLTASDAAAARTVTGLTVRYFAYGSNMLSELLARRIGSALPMKARGGFVRDYALAFSLPGFALEPAFASCDPSAGSVCHGVLYTLEFVQWLRLCASEGVPSAYRIQEVSVECYDGSREDAYSLRATFPLPFSLPPSRRYLDLLKDGAREVIDTDAHGCGSLYVALVSLTLYLTGRA